MNSRQKGLTMLELMFVLSIITLILAMMIPGFNNYFLNSKIDSVEVEIRSMKSSVSQYFIDNEQADFDKDILKSYFDYELEEVDSGVTDLIEFRTKNKLDPWKNPYVIFMSKKDVSFVSIMSYGPNGKKDLSETSVGDDILMIYYNK